MSKELEKARELVKMLEEREEAGQVELSSLIPGDVFKIGEHDFIVLEQKEEGTAVISKGLMKENVEFDDDSTEYTGSNLEKVMQEEVYPIISSAVGSDNMLQLVGDLVSVDMQRQYDTWSGFVRPLTFDEARKYNDLLVNKDLPDWYWTLTPWSTADRGWKYNISVVSPAGYFDYFSCYISRGGVRPFCILKSNIFVSKGER